MSSTRSTASRKDIDPLAEQEVRHRAAALPPEERRASIISATLELLCAHGTNVNTRQIAEAAGVAEGTIFRVFDDKDSVIEAAIESAFDAEPLDRDLRAIDRSLTLEERLHLAASIIQLRVAAIWNLMSAVGPRKPPARYRAGDAADEGNHRLPGLTALAELLEPDRARLRREPDRAAELFRGLVYGCTHPTLVIEPIEPGEIVSLFLDGIETDGAPRC